MNVERRLRQLAGLCLKSPPCSRPIHACKWLAHWSILPPMLSGFESNVTCRLSLLLAEFSPPGCSGFPQHQHFSKLTAYGIHPQVKQSRFHFDLP